jgi:hypothetical protein
MVRAKSNGVRSVEYLVTRDDKSDGWVVLRDGMLFTSVGSRQKRRAITLAGRTAKIENAESDHFAVAVLIENGRRTQLWPSPKKAKAGAASKNIPRSKIGEPPPSSKGNGRWMHSPLLRLFHYQ